jgi:hypothetical protein
MGSAVSGFVGWRTAAVRLEFWFDAEHLCCVIQFRVIFPKRLFRTVYINIFFSLIGVY